MPENADTINADIEKRDVDGNCHPADNDNCIIAWGNILS